jgi:hypothetical protein
VAFFDKQNIKNTADSYEYGNENSGCKKFEKYLDQMGDY